MTVSTLLLAQAGEDSADSDSAESSQEFVSFHVGLTARDTWEGNNPQNYAYTLGMQCYCSLPQHVRVYVSNGRVIRVTDLDNRRDITDPKLQKLYNTIPEYFALIDEAVAKRPDSMTVVYERYLGYPSKILINHSYRMADEELDFQLSDVTVNP